VYGPDSITVRSVVTHLSLVVTCVKWVAAVVCLVCTGRRSVTLKLLKALQFSLSISYVLALLIGWVDVIDMMALVLGSSLSQN
jgi:CHASE2 domain-containing sensor protein